jgi:hypothetical protein
VQLAVFQGDGKLDVVQHPIKWMGLTYSPSLPLADVADRAQWLLANQPPPYRVGYRNFESIAIWCKTGDFESFQFKRVSRWGVMLSSASVLLLRRRSRWRLPVVTTSTAISFFGSVPYIMDRGFFVHTRRYAGRGGKWTVI